MSDTPTAFEIYSNTRLATMLTERNTAYIQSIVDMIKRDLLHKIETDIPFLISGRFECNYRIDPRQVEEFVKKLKEVFPGTLIKTGNSYYSRSSDDSLPQVLTPVTIQIVLVEAASSD